MAAPVTSYFSLRDDALIDAITHGYFWKLDVSKTIDFSVSNGFFNEYWYAPDEVGRYLQSALSTYSQYIDVQFNYLGQFNTPAQSFNAGSEINLSLDSRIIQDKNIWAVGFYPNSGEDSIWYPGASSDILINVNSAANSLPNFEPGSQGWFLILHELGHTLGLKHPHDDGGTGRPTFRELNIAWMDIDWASIMSYNDDFGYDLIRYDPASPMILDVLGLQFIYGKNFQYNSSDNRHFLNESNFYYTLWDASGIDSLDVSLASQAWTIYLPNNAWSNLVSTRVGFAFPTSAVLENSPTTFIWLAGDYENITGSRFDDLFNGNLFDNHINGGPGIDTAIYQGLISDYVFESTTEFWNASIPRTSLYELIVQDLTTRDGTDTLINIERLQFTDTMLALDTGRFDNAGAAYMLYQAAYDRTPDAAGLGYWIDRLDKGASIVTDVAEYFVNYAPEFTQLYGANPSTRQYVDLLYRNVLNRPANLGGDVGYLYWENQLNSGQMSEAFVLASFANSLENVANVASAIANGIQYQAYVG